MIRAALAVAALAVTYAGKRRLATLGSLVEHSVALCIIIAAAARRMSCIGPPGDLVIGALYGLLLVGCEAHLFGWSWHRQIRSSRGTRQAGGLVLIVILWSALAEEAFWRLGVQGLVFGNSIWGTIVTAIAFGAKHDQGRDRVAQAAGLTLPTLALSVGFAMTHSLGIVVAMHFVRNLVIFAGLGRGPEGSGP